MNLAEILKDSSYKLSQFTAAEIEQLEETITLKPTKTGEVPYTVCLVRQKPIKLTPEEVIRQLYLRVLTGRLDYPLSRIQVEYGVNFGREVKRADIVVMDKSRLNTVYILVEVKKPKLKDGKDQLKSYCNGCGAPIAVWTNGDQISYYHRKDPNYFEDLSDLPTVNQTLADILQIKFTLEDLIAKDKLVKENKSLKELIEEMEDEVLANAGVDVFEELFTLIFTKLYDEWYSGQGSRRKTRCLEFRNTGQTESDLKAKIQDLFDKAKQKWEGVFSDDAKITLTPSHLAVCISSLENVKLFNSNLDVVDEAFEYLINQSSKGDKGQFFTPRYVIDMCVKMLNPQEEEYMIDTAAGSSGFPVHTIFHVWRQILVDEGLEASHLFSLEDKPPRCKEYVEDKVFAIDFDEKAVRVARTLNLIAGDGETNVLHLNTLDYKRWEEVIKQQDWQDIYSAGFKRLRRLRPRKSDDYREFQFDILMANPPFAGDIKESGMISGYDLAQKPNGKGQTKIGRDILFIERNLDFLKPGGRMAIVLPQGRFNNSSDKNIRDFIADRCRILAVVGLHGNTFKPHTGTKTSVLFVQKWNDDPNLGALCPRKDDYQIFFATMQKSGKDNSGEKIYLKNGSGDFLLDDHNHRIVDQDLYNHDGLTQDGIAEAFIEFAKKENLSFFELSSSVAPFDVVKYQRLMDGLEAVELQLSYVIQNSDKFRFDSDYFQKVFLAASRTIYNYQPLSHYVEFGYRVVYEATEIIDAEEGKARNCPIFLQATDITTPFIETSNLFYVDETDWARYHQGRIKKGELLIEVKGKAEKIAIVPDDFPEKVLVTGSLYKLTVNHEINEYYLLIYLITKYGIAFRNRYKSNLLISFISKQELYSIPIPSFSTEFQLIIENIFKELSRLRNSSKLVYQEAEDLLLSELGLVDWQPTEETIAIKSFAESFLSSGRLDAEYYQPKYDQVEKAIKDCGFETQNLGSLIEPIQNGFDYRDYTEEGTPYIRVGDIKNGQINFESAVKIPISIADVDKPVGLQIGDILFTRKGSFGNSAVVTELEVAGIISSEIMLVRLNLHYKQEIFPEYISLFLNSKFGYLQVERRVHGVAYYSISQPDLANLLIPILPKLEQQKIVEKVKSSFCLKLKSKQLLEIAKIGVERAIETDEATATAWINQQLSVLEVNLA